MINHIKDFCKIDALVFQHPVIILQKLCKGAFSSTEVNLGLRKSLTFYERDQFHHVKYSHDFSYIVYQAFHLFIEDSRSGINFFDTTMYRTVSESFTNLLQALGIFFKCFSTLASFSAFLLYKRLEFTFDVK